jgi:hypothetical protein
MNRWLSISGLVLSILAILVATWLLVVGYGWLRQGKPPSVGVAVAEFGLVVGVFFLWLLRKRS